MVTLDHAVHFTKSACFHFLTYYNWIVPRFPLTVPFLNVLFVLALSMLKKNHIPLLHVSMMHIYIVLIKINFLLLFVNVMYSFDFNSFN